MKDIVFYSMGICSAYIACRLKDECADPICLFSDTKREDEDTYRFGRQVAERWNLNIVEASHGGDLWEMFVKQNFIPARQFSTCSLKFKILPSRAYLTANYEDAYTGATELFPHRTFEKMGRVAYGYDLGEERRVARTQANWDFKSLDVWFPLLEWQVSKQQCFGYFQQHGIEPPRMYKHFQHANCLPCKNFQKRDWEALAYHYPEKFAEAAIFEKQHGLRWMQDGCTLIELALSDSVPSRKGRRKLAGDEPAFSFDMGCDRCAID